MKQLCLLLSEAWLPCRTQPQPFIQSITRPISMGTDSLLWFFSCLFYSSIIFCVLLKTSNTHLFWQHPWTLFCSGTLVKTWIFPDFSQVLHSTDLFKMLFPVVLSLGSRLRSAPFQSYSSLRSISPMLYK